MARDSTARVSVVIPTYNRAQFLGAAIQSALDQSMDGVEIVVVDDGSTDGTEDLVRRFDSAVIYLRTPHRGQPAATRNRGLGVARGELIALLDSDDLFLPGKLSAQMAIFRDHSALARLAYRESMGMDPSLEAMIRDFYRETAEIQARNIRAAQSLGLLRPCDPLLTAYAHIGMVERILLAMIDHPEAFPEPREVVRQTMRLAYDGLRAPGAPSLLD